MAPREQECHINEAFAIAKWLMAADVLLANNEQDSTGESDTVLSSGH